MRTFLFTCKRILMLPSFFILMGIFLLTELVLLNTQNPSTDKIYIALYPSQNDSVSSLEDDITNIDFQLLTDKLNKQDGMFIYYLCSNYNQLSKDINSGKCKAGYIATGESFSTDHVPQTLFHIVKNEDFELASVVNLQIYSTLFQIYSDELMYDTVKDYLPVTQEECKLAFKEILDDKVTAALDIKSTDIQSTQNPSILFYVIHSALCSCACLWGVYYYLIDRETKRYSGLSIKNKRILPLGYILMPFLTYSILSIMVNGLNVNLIFGTLLSLPLFFIVGFLTKKRVTLITCLPILLIAGSIISVIPTFINFLS